MPWNPTLYNRFKTERSAPFDDLLVLIDRRPSLHVIDLGCGTGELSSRLADVLPGATVLGIDASRNMLRETEHFRRSNLSFRQETIEEVLHTTERYDLVFSNAALQWLDRHEDLWPRLIHLLKPGGQLAVQIPSNHHHRTHMLLREMAAMPPFSEAFNGWSRQSPVLSIEAYARLLFAAGGSNITVLEKVYPHVLQDADALADWTAGTALIPYLERLPQNLQETFSTSYRAALREAFPGSPVFYPFRRTLMAATF